MKLTFTNFLRKFQYISLTNTRNIKATSGVSKFALDCFERYFLADGRQAMLNLLEDKEKLHDMINKKSNGGVNK